MRTKSTVLFTLAAAGAGLVGALAGGAAPATASTVQHTTQVSANAVAAAVKPPGGLVCTVDYVGTLSGKDKLSIRSPQDDC
jgi:hypothetical protein